MSITLCRGCIRSYHKENPFHKIEQWNGKYFRPAELWEVGTYLLIRHHFGNALCDNLLSQERFLEMLEGRKDDAEQESLKMTKAPEPSTAEETSSSSAFNWATHNQANDAFEDDVDMADPDKGVEDVSDEEFFRYVEELRDKAIDDSGDDGNAQDGGEIDDDVDEEEADEQNPNKYLPMEINAEYNIGSAQRVVGTYVRVVHSNGIHNIAMISCECRGHDVLPSDLVAARLLPASFERIRTLFSAQLLDFFRLCNLELKATAYQFYHLLQRLTNPMAPAEVDNLYREFRRMSRIWRWMKRLKWAGYGNGDKKVGESTPGELTVFCPACPQPSINIPDNWKEDPARYV
jgi:CxC2 like cysteine cluster associated with KDZ transposases